MEPQVGYRIKLSIDNLRTSDEAFQILKKPMQDSEFASAMEVNKTQASDWLKRLMKEGVVKKTKRPVRYVIDQENLFV